MQLQWIIITNFAFFIIAQSSCPFAQRKEDGSKFNSRGHNKPFGHHAKNWKRVHTVYEHPDPETFYNEYVRLSKPLFIKGGAADWPALHKWKNLSYINEMGGKERSTVLWKGIYDYDKFHPIRIDMTMKEFTSKFDSNLLYMDATMQAGLIEDMYWPHSLGCKFFTKRVKQLAIMMNSGKSKSPLHIDATDTYFIQVTGNRLWLMVPPDQAKHAYSGHPHLVDHSGISILNQTFMDLEKYPDAANMDIYAAYLNPGDIVYVPEGWLHQVVTDGKPNIGAPVFLNILFCEYNNKNSNDSSDVAYISNCINEVRERKPKTLQCNKFPTDKITVAEMLKQQKPRNADAFREYFGQETMPAHIRHRKFRYKLHDGSYIQALGMSLTGMSKEALEQGSVLKQGVLEGYKLFCTAPNDGSEEALGKFIRSRPRFRKRISILSYLSLEQHLHSPSSVARSIDASLNNLNTSTIDFLLLQAPYCKPDYQVKVCTRNNFHQSWADVWKALEHIQRQRKIRHLGLSDFSLAEIKQLAAVATIPITLVRARFDLYFRNIQLRHYCKKNKIQFMGRSVLGGRWKEEQPDFHRDIFHEHALKKMAYHYKTSLHASVYDWAIKKNVIVCPRVNDPLHVRVNVKAIDSESASSVDYLYPVDEIDPTDKDGLHVPGAHASDFSRSTFSHEEVTAETHKEQGSQDTKRPSQLFEKNNKNDVYTDDKDFEIFPTYMLGEDNS